MARVVCRCGEWSVSGPRWVAKCVRVRQFFLVGGAGDRGGGGWAAPPRPRPWGLGSARGVGRRPGGHLTANACHIRQIVSTHSPRYTPAAMRRRAEPAPGGRSHLGNLPQPRMRAGGGIPLQGHCTLPTSRSSFSNREIYKCFFSPKRLRLLRVNGDVGATTKSGLRRREVGPLPSLSPVP